jgi:AraC-like DNA-binding protein
LAGFRVLGLDVEALQREAGLDASMLARLDGVFEDVCFERLWSAAFARAPREELPTEVGLAIPFGAFGALDYLAGTSADVEAGFVVFARHVRQVATQFRVEVGEGENGAGLVQLVWLRGAAVAQSGTCLPEFGGRDVSDEFTLATCIGRFKAQVDGAFRVSAVRLTRPAPAATTRHASLLGAPVTFGCAVSALEIARESWKASLRRADATLQETLRRLASHLELGEVSSDLELALRARLRVLLADGTPSAAVAAQSLGLTERTLQRQLKEAGTSFTRVLDEFRQAEAERHLSNGLPFADLALRLGFADQTTWNRAFRRWKGMSPRQWVLEHGAAVLPHSTVSGK